MIPESSKSILELLIGAKGRPFMIRILLILLLVSSQTTNFIPKFMPKPQ